MIKNDSRIVLILIIFIFCNFIYLWAERSNKTVDIILRTGQGGFNDNRSDIGKLGGGQIAIDLKLTNYPLALSVSGEYYTNSPAPTNPYEISDMTVFNLLYMKKPFKTDRINVFAGGGLGWLKVPKDFSEDKTNTGMVFDLEAGANVRVIWKLGFYAIYKYLYAQKERNNVKVIDFNEHIGMIGISLNLSF